jgi:hypothetical protein
MFPYLSTFFSSNGSAVEILEDEDEDDSAYYPEFLLSLLSRIVPSSFDDSSSFYLWQ